MGDEYLLEETSRREYIAKFSDNNIIIFPQTIHFSSSKLGREQLQITKTAYAKHRHLTLIAREKDSYELLLTNFPNNTVLLTPDIVLSLDLPKSKYRRSGVLICVRDDVEGVLSERQKQDIPKMVGSLNIRNIASTDMISRSKYFSIRFKNRIVGMKLKQFSKSQLVITDRLHGMVFAAVTGTPCIAFANYNHKVIGTYKWISKLPYIRFCNNYYDLGSLVDSIDISKEYTYDPHQFSSEWRLIIEAIRAPI